jgi:hypothetical protein
MPPTPAAPDQSLSLPPVLSARLRTVAAAECLSVDAVVCAAVADYLQRHLSRNIGELGQVFATSHSTALTRLAR